MLAIALLVDVLLIAFSLWLLPGGPLRQVRQCQGR